MDSSQGPGPASRPRSFSLGSLLTVFVPAEQDLLRGFVERGVVQAGDPGADSTGEAGGLESEGDPETSAAHQEARNQELIAKRIARIGPYETQDLVAGILQALAYTTEVAAPGADRGLDIVACKDALFLQPPIVKAQVKARPDSKTGPDDIR